MKEDLVQVLERNENVTLFAAQNKAMIPHISYRIIDEIEKTNS